MAGTIDKPGAAGRAVAAETFADRERRNPYFRWLVHLGLPAAASLVVHSVLLVLLAVRTWQVLSATPAGEYGATVVSGDPLAGAFQWSGADALPQPDDVPPDALDALRDLSDVGDFSLRDLTQMESSSGAGASEGDSFGIGEGRLSLHGVGAGAGESGTGGFGSGVGGGGRGVGTAGMWGKTIAANRIAYVVDFSGSIIVAVDDLKRELKRSIAGLRASQTFNVIVFFSLATGQQDQYKTESFAPKLVPAEDDARRDFIQWLDRKSPMGGTEPLPALRRAISMNPEAILFFSDGYFDEAVVGEVKRANARANARIFCYVFDELLLQQSDDLPPRMTDGARRLERIAQQNNGWIKIVTGSDIRRR
ncbi:hypothetical protein RAS1_04270 [Phycisphaerae bacterium RAS1]|nr:hypothetical protein RAS1_04270 [Phycisphaerae bacterium RAS1]